MSDELDRARAAGARQARAWLRISKTPVSAGMLQLALTTKATEWALDQSLAARQAYVEAGAAVFREEATP